MQHSHSKWPDYDLCSLTCLSGISPLLADFRSATPQSVAEGLWHASSAAPPHPGRSFRLQYLQRILMPPPCCASAHGSSDTRRETASLSQVAHLLAGPHQGLTSEEHTAELAARAIAQCSFREPCLGCSSPAREPGLAPSRPAPIAARRQHNQRTSSLGCDVSERQHLQRNAQDTTPTLRPMPQILSFAVASAITTSPVSKSFWRRVLSQ